MVAVILIISGTYFLLGAFTLQTCNFWSSFLFKFIPFVFGVTNIAVGLDLLNIIKILK